MSMDHVFFVCTHCTMASSVSARSSESLADARSAQIRRSPSCDAAVLIPTCITSRSHSLVDIAISANRVAAVLNSEESRRRRSLTSSALLFSDSSSRTFCKMPKRKITAVTQQRRGVDPEQQYLLEKQQLLSRVGAVQGLLGLFNRQDPQDPDGRSLLWLPGSSYYEVGRQQYFPARVLERLVKQFQAQANEVNALSYSGKASFDDLDALHTKLDRTFDVHRGLVRVRLSDR